MASTTLSAYTAIFSYPIVRPATVSYTATWSNLGPLTTIFTPPISCNTPVATNLFVQGRTTWAHDCDWTRTADLPRPDCYPSYTAPDPAVIAGGDNFWLPGEQKFYYSPGYSCPAGWQAATTLTTAASSVLGVWDGAQKPLALRDMTGTQIVCCPNAWTLGGLVQCYSRLEVLTRLQVCAEQTRTFNHTNLTPRLTVTGSTMVAYTTPAVLLVHDARPREDGSSDTTKIAVGVVVPMVVLLAIVVGIVFYLRRRRPRGAVHQYGFKATQPSSSDRGDDQPVELDANVPSQAFVRFAKPELDGSDPSRRLLAHEKAELEGHQTTGRQPGGLRSQNRGTVGMQDELGELEDTARREMSYETRATGEVPSSLRPSRREGT